MFVVSCALLMVGGVSSAQDDAEGSKDHPMFSRMPGYAIGNYDAQDFANFELALDPAKKVEGRYWRIDYVIKDGARKAGPLQIARNHTDLLVRRGGKKLVEEVSAGGGTTVAEWVSGSGHLWLQIDIANEGEMFTLTVVEEAAMEQQVEFTSTELAAALNSTGFVALHNILFDTGKASLQPSSSAALAPVGELLKSDRTLKLEIQGHTDNVGAAPANLKLSQDRAAAVKTYLVQTFGIEASRLTTKGMGDTTPVADNRTEPGRAQNRRVELVKK
jgi:outer membrane protein OmpA-like peptidoglycan-associated protein